MEETIQPQAICRSGRQRIVYIGIPASCKDNVGLADAVKATQEAAAKLGDSYRVQLRSAE